MSADRCRLSSLRPMAARRATRLLALLVLPGLFAAGCITRPVKQSVFNDGYTEVMLRSEKKGRTTVEKHFSHPESIAPVRIAHILSRIDMRKTEDKDRIPAIPLDTLFTMAKGMSEALAAADPNQEVVVQSIRRSTRKPRLNHEANRCSKSESRLSTASASAASGAGSRAGRIGRSCRSGRG